VPAPPPIAIATFVLCGRFNSGVFSGLLANTENVLKEKEVTPIQSSFEAFKRPLLRRFTAFLKHILLAWIDDEDVLSRKLSELVDTRFSLILIGREE
jgi:hypothetical protein